MLIYRPIDSWPGALTATRDRSPFDAPWRSTMELLDREVHHLQGHSVSERRNFHAHAVVQLAVPEGAIRQDVDLSEPDSIKAAYRVAAAELHPDRGGDPAAFRLVTDARDLLLAEVSS